MVNLIHFKISLRAAQSLLQARILMITVYNHLFSVQSQQRSTETLVHPPRYVSNRPVIIQYMLRELPQNANYGRSSTNRKQHKKRHKMRAKYLALFRNVKRMHVSESNELIPRRDPTGDRVLAF